MTQAMSEEGFLRLFMLTLNEAPAAAALCFDYRDTMYLYNSGYDPQYGSLSAGLLCKILSIRHSIEIGRKKYDFLKGAEPYKYHLGGKEVHLRRCRISFG
jgi:CelD/BcsL family acetyltransferase involved in cellulose biosynthesis